MTAPERIKVREAAKVLGVSPYSLADRRWRRKHAIPASRIGKALVFDVRQLEAYLVARRERFGGNGDRS